MQDIISNLDGAVNRGHKQTDLIIMDFAKAFDKVPHRRLLHKLDYYGIRGSTHKWINSWLSGRTQKGVLDGQASDPVPVLSGVPQGSVLGPILFLIFLAHLSRRLMGELIVYQSLRRPSVVRPSTISNIFSSETTWPIELKFHMETP